MKRTSPFLVLILLLTACGPSRTNAVATRTAIVEASFATQTALVERSVPTPTVTPKPSCVSEAVAYLAELEPHYRKFSDTEQVAGQTARIALAPVVQSLQAIKRDIEDIPAPYVSSLPVLSYSKA